MSVRRKLTVMSFGIGLLVSIIASSAFFVFLVVYIEERLGQEVASVAGMVAENAGQALTQGDSESARKILEALVSNRMFVAAAVVEENGGVFAEFNPDGVPLGDLSSMTPGTHHEGELRTYLRPIPGTGRGVASLALVVDHRSTRITLLVLFASMLVWVALIAMGLSLALSSFFKRYVTSPILQLLETTMEVSGRGDFSIRAQRTTDDEVGILTSAFNGMLDKIEDQNRELHEQRVRFEHAVGGSMDGVWDWDMKEDRHFWSERFREILGVGTMDASLENFLSFVHPDDREEAVQHWKEVVSGGMVQCDAEFRIVLCSGGFRWVHWRGMVAKDVEGEPVRLSGALTDITERKEGERQTQEMARKLVETSRRAGMAEIATGVLHNVGNVLNSINVSATLISDRLKMLPVERLEKVVNLLERHEKDLPGFFSESGKGRMLPRYLSELVEAGRRRTKEIEAEAEALVRNVEHVKEIVSMQQSYAKVSGLTETLPVNELLEDAIRLNSNIVSSSGIRIFRDYTSVPALVNVDKHKVLQILINLLSNAVHALEVVEIPQKRIELGIIRCANQRVAISVEDNGVGIETGNLEKIFSHGFTTKRRGHGFGLHSSALAARQMGGELNVTSEGAGQGARFTLLLPEVQLTQGRKRRELAHV